LQIRRIRRICCKANRAAAFYFKAELHNTSNASQLKLAEGREFESHQARFYTEVRREAEQSKKKIIMLSEDFFYIAGVAKSG